MGRRSDHSREQLEALILEEGHRHMAESGFAKFSSREVAKRIGYSVGTLYNVFGSYDRLIVAINTRTFDLWAAFLEQRLASRPQDRIAALVEGYFRFASENTNIWMAIYDHRLPPGVPMPDDYARQRAGLTEIVVREVAAVLPPDAKDVAPRLARSLVATVHGHCTFALNGSFALLGETAPLEMATARVKESLRAAGAKL
ncbi:TetR family transcriptional regulator [Sphingobium sp. 22B]|uniref:TetR/AcrR family transcriptional regulator n=1 Tax=unclassified Sphingobium TaxID=2611147 RepID=UPI0007867D73|nr:MULTISPECIES: TetR/AcrR family transcriptional regulator [unclassified Sphingobium]KXU31671.1 TetR family transcriptional regulator [Sphingobium sp. AM]KYC33004.1 TetR family transcriptional regulator [Sphingobium sp. 22B]OAP30618.1 TetR family transcriptional regulator [Sphingobium sp. 20006FA]